MPLEWFYYFSFTGFAETRGPDWGPAEATTSSNNWNEWELNTYRRTEVTDIKVSHHSTACTVIAYQVMGGRL